MAKFLLMAISDRVINRLPLESLREAHNLKDFLEQGGGYHRVDVYEVRRTGETCSELWQLDEVMQ